VVGPHSGAAHGAYDRRLFGLLLDGWNGEQEKVEAEEEKQEERALAH
jgi:hypothetical protein